jgi:hypothetical protein
MLKAAFREEEELWRQGYDVIEDEEEKGLMQRELHPLEMVSSHVPCLFKCFKIDAINGCILTSGTHVNSLLKSYSSVLAWFTVTLPVRVNST